MNVTSLAQELRNQADDIINNHGLGEVLERFGDVFYTGSYFLDTMVYPDLDIEILMDGDPLSIPNFMEIAKRLAALDFVVRINYCNMVRKPAESMPLGLYHGIKTNLESTSRTWKIDLWAKTETECREHRKDVADLRQRMDEESRALILDIKYSLLTPEGRTPMMCGYQIYRAILREGLIDRDDILHYVREQGVDIPVDA